MDFRRNSRSREWIFKVQAATSPGEVVCVTGSCAELGQWHADRVLPLRLLSSVPDSETEPHCRLSENIWSSKISIPDGTDVKYRYAVCMFIPDVQHGTDAKLVIRRWESDLKARKVGCHDACDESVVDNYGCKDGGHVYNVQHGWLVHDTLVQLKLHGAGVLQIWKKKHRNKDFYLKVTPVETSNCSLAVSSSSLDLEESMDISEAREEKKVWPLVVVSKSNAEQCELRAQSQFGVLYEEDSFVLFQARFLEPSTVAFVFDVFARPKQQQHSNNPDELPEHIGCGYVLPEHFKSTEGRVKKPIISRRFQPIGQFCVDYLLIRPIKSEKSPLCDFKASYANHWKPNWKGLDVAHRGLGNSYTMAQHCSNVRENTIASLKNAVDHGADMVEFDVQLSKDLVPVIFHEFELCASIAKKNGEHHLVEMQLKNLTLEQLQHLKTHHPWEKSNGLSKSFSDDPDHQPFPTLERAFEAIDIHAGFNIEVKWDMEKLDGSRESHNALELNLFVDTILETVLQHSHSRKVVFSSFNPDICTVLSYKQNKYPVLFLTQGVNSKYGQYHDRRTHTVLDGSNFVLTCGLLGLNVMAEDVQRDPSQVDFVKSRGQVMFCWTDDQNDPSFVQYLKGLGIDGIIYDRIDVNNRKEVKESIFLIEQREEGCDDESSHLPAAAACSCSASGKSNKDGTADEQNNLVKPDIAKNNVSFRGVLP